MFGELFKREHPDLVQQTLMVRCEMTECRTLLDVHFRVASGVLEELSRVVGLDLLNSAATRKGVALRVPSAIELSQMAMDELDQFIATIGVLVDAADTPEMLGDRAPIGMCLLLDNSDQLEDDLIAQIDQWAYDLGSKGVTATMVFFRPSTFSRIVSARQVQSDHLTNRLPFGVVVPPPLVDVLQRRIQLLLAEVGSKATTVAIGDMPSEFGAQITVGKLRQLSATFVKSLSATGGALLPSFAGSNVRRTLQSFDWIIGSWVMDSGALFTAITTGKQLPTEGGRSGWPRLLESFMLGPRRWYVPDFSPVESLFHPPSIDATGDHLIAIHLMQIIELGGKRGLNGSRDKRMTLGRLLDGAGEAHYSIPRVLHVLHWLADHESRDDEDATLYRATPLIATSSQGIQRGGGLEEPHDLNSQLRITKWGEYHLKTLIYQLRYWKHIYYDLVLPRETEAKLLGHNEAMTGEFLFQNLNVVVDFLTSYEDDWLRDVPIAPSVGIVPLMPTVSEMLRNQMGRGQSRP